MIFDFKNSLRATTAICLVSTVSIATVAYAASWGGVSNWDKRPHHNRFAHDGRNGGNNGNHNGSGNGNGNNNNNNDPADKLKTASPIKHVIILIGENRGLDHTFGVYKPKGKGETISNLLSKGIVNQDGSPGPNFAKAQQFSVAAQPSFYLSPPAIAKAPYNATNLMPQPNTAGTPTAASDTSSSVQDDRRSERRGRHGSVRSRHPDDRLQRFGDQHHRHPRSRRRHPDGTVRAAGPEPQRRRLHR